VAPWHRTHPSNRGSSVRIPPVRFFYKCLDDNNLAGGLNKFRAIAITERRGAGFKNVSTANTVFKEAPDFWLCSTDNFGDSVLAVSR
jgi:hypothetical protein